MYNVKILGAGSIGNHLSNASRRLGWQVTLCDVDPAALERTKNDIYPARYGQWDETIHLCSVAEAPKGGFDLIFIGTCSDTHMDLAIQAIAEKPKALLIEKPLCTPKLERTDELKRLAEESGVTVFVGYNHIVSPATEKTVEIAPSLGAIETLDVEFREYWGGIFKAHPWLAGPQDSYLGFWQRGGGAGGEHSHAINLWQHLARSLGAGRVTEVTASLDFVHTDELYYDKLCMLHLRTENGLVGRVVQDVITQPPRKWGRVQGKDGYVEIEIGSTDYVRWAQGGEKQECKFEKTRPDDFIVELKHLDAVLKGERKESGIALECGLETILVVAAAHLSNEQGRRIQIDYSKGYSHKAFKAV
ncbi:MAG: Gfo/Idh/MocA family oxidoreductase [Desulfuromusa sp.]|nr:Gfo/Idh/MocA family oxidoreductase [Desulfuromusa sp.]